MASASVRDIHGSRASAGLVRWPLLAISLLAAIAFAADTYLVLTRPYFPLDLALARAAQAVNWGPLAQSFGALDWFEGWKQVAAAGLGLLLVYLLRRRAFWLMGWGVLSGAAYQLLELVVQRPRPPAGLVHVVRHTTGYSFPSGHLVFFSWFGAYLILVFGGRLPRAVKALLWLLYLLLLAAVAVSRVYTAEHWPTDVLAGLLLGGAWTLFGLSIRGLSDPVLAA